MEVEVEVKLVEDRNKKREMENYSNGCLVSAQFGVWVRLRREERVCKSKRHIE